MTPTSESGRPAGTGALPGWRSLALVALGGTVGTALREAVALTVPPLAGVPVATAGINVSGAFLLGLLLEVLTCSRDGDARSADLGLLLGTGLLGGFTTYSALAVDANLLLAAGQPGLSVIYAVGTLALGALAAFLGILAGAAARHRRSRNVTAGSQR
ncbi:CrcB family protein [Planctomonas psychrotolerans]|uniref:CrcB family protein n=1 Tax=Planctomonas psychrotolerans TaxID=2528712 RepID=UPI001238A01F|nr:CrcB family protein [Planctomonas psychrotolerans]